MQLGEFLLPRKKPEATIDQHITNVLKDRNPKTVKELVRLIQREYPIPEQKILEYVLRLRDRGNIVLEEYPAPLSPSIKGYLFSKGAKWYWVIIFLAVITTALVFTIPEDAIPMVYARYLLGSIFVLWLPGYTFIKALFPAKELDSIERAALSIGMSLALVPIAGLLLNYTPWGIRVTPVTLSLLALTITFATAAIIRERQAKIKEIPSASKHGL